MISPEVSCDMAHYTNLVFEGHIFVETDVEEDHEKDNLQKVEAER